MTDWQPSATFAVMQSRAQLMQSIRDFFTQRAVLEVETPMLAHAGVTDPHLVNAVTRLSGPGLPKPTDFYLQTSPEYAMKRLLAAGSGSIFQIARVVRDDEIGRYHNPEFSMLEWYRVDFNEHQLMDEMDALLQLTLQCGLASRISYQQLFIQHLGLDPLTEQGLCELETCLRDHGLGNIVDQTSDTDTWLQLAMSHLIEPHIGIENPCFVYDFPASQAALAQISTADPRVARRFEVYFRGIELANGFYELTDSAQQEQRFEVDNQARLALGKTVAPADRRLLAALASGLPACAGVALGLDRLLMLKLGARHINEVLAFPTLSA
ncbi:elongation factor P--(R)-beta-lysine ligase [Aliidiomarina sp. Khilg15.8]